MYLFLKEKRSSAPDCPFFFLLDFKILFINNVQCWKWGWFQNSFSLNITNLLTYLSLKYFRASSALSGPGSIKHNNQLLFPQYWLSQQYFSNFDYPLVAKAINCKLLSNLREREKKTSFSPLCFLMLFPRIHLVKWEARLKICVLLFYM